MLKCVSRYKSSLGVYTVGDIINDAVLELALLTDSPLSFAQAIEPEPEVKAAEPDEDKMMRKGRVK